MKCRSRRQFVPTQFSQTSIRPTGAALGDHFILYQPDAELANARILEVLRTNVLRSTTNAETLRLVPFSDAQASFLLAIQNAAETATSFGVRGDGRIVFGRPVQPHIDMQSLRLVPFSDAQASTIFELTNAAQTLSWLFVATSGQVVLSRNLRSKAGADVENLRLVPFSNAQASDLLNVTNAAETVSHFEVRPTGRVVVGTGVLPDGGGVKHGRSAALNVPANSATTFTFAWTTAFADNNYTAVVSVESDLVSNQPPRFAIFSKSATGLSVSVFNSDTISATVCTVHVHAFHD
jgi:hypothetical protein